MTLQPEALRWADILESYHLRLGRLDATGAATELRRLHTLNQELLEALKTVMGDANHGQHMTWTDRCKQARAAIAKAEGEKQ